jgi:KRAB domain-containing zinc finger protein
LTDYLKNDLEIEKSETKSKLRKTKLQSIPPETIPRSKPKSEDFRCFFCDKVFLKISLKNEHIKKDHVKELHCSVCKTKKPSSISTEKCLRDHQLGFDFLCQICAKPFRHKYYLLKHQATFHAEANDAEFYSCDACGLQTKYKMNLYRHVKSVHLNSHKFPCPYSDKCSDVTYTTKEGLNIHMYRVHDLKAPVTCTSCNLGFSFVSELKIHRKICGGNTSRTPGVGTKNRNFKQFCEVIDDGFKCKVCCRIFKEKQNWSYHYSSTHRNNRTCHECNKEFTNYTNFYRHVNVQHKHIKKFHCDYPNCEKSFGQKGSLMNHKNTHTGS